MRTNMMRNQEQLNEIQNELYSAVICDILDQLGYPQQSMNTVIRPLDPDKKIVGYAYTALSAKVFEVPTEPYKLELEALDHISPGEVFVVHAGSIIDGAFWGELLTEATIARGGRGAVIDGLIRDAEKIKKLNFPVFMTGFHPTDSKGRVDVIQYQVPVIVGDVKVYPGDLIFGDMDGIVVIPSQLEELVLQQSLEKVRGENIVREALRNGMSATEAFRRFGIL